MDRRYFTNGTRTDWASTPADVVVFIHNGWQECAAPSAKASKSKQKPDGAADPDNSIGEDELPNGEADSQ